MTSEQWPGEASRDGESLQEVGQPTADASAAEGEEEESKAVAKQESESNDIDELYDSRINLAETVLAEI